MSFDKERDHLPTKADYMETVIHRLETLCEDILAEIDGGEECRGRDSQLSAWGADIENAITMLKSIR
jgi:hypothetical protein